jgi:hypothetical protein
MGRTWGLKQVLVARFIAIFPEDMDGARVRLLRRPWLRSSVVMLAALMADLDLPACFPGH